MSFFLGRRALINYLILYGTLTEGRLLPARQLIPVLCRQWCLIDRQNACFHLEFKYRAAI